MHQLQRSWVRSQHPSAQWNLRCGRWSSVKYSTKKKFKKSPTPPKKRKKESTVQYLFKGLLILSDSILSVVNTKSLIFLTVALLPFIRCFPKRKVTKQPWPGEVWCPPMLISVVPTFLLKQLLSYCTFPSQDTDPPLSRFHMMTHTELFLL
jgi:hypothetical protein